MATPRKSKIGIAKKKLVDFPGLSQLNDAQLFVKFFWMILMEINIIMKSIGTEIDEYKSWFV